MATVSPTIMGVSKTTINGVLAFLIATLSMVVMYQIPTNLMNPQVTHIWTYVCMAANFILALCRCWVGLLQGDSTTTTKN